MDDFEVLDNFEVLDDDEVHDDPDVDELTDTELEAGDDSVDSYGLRQEETDEETDVSWFSEIFSRWAFRAEGGAFFFFFDEEECREDVERCAEEAEEVEDF